ncbi:MAG TPA: MlaD family protein, partial [Polyangia bacterium]
MKSLEYKVGALIVVSLVLLGGFLALLGNFSFRGGTRIRINYDFSGNLQSGAAVKVSGIKVGKVEEVRYLGGEVDPDTGKRVQVRVVAFVEDRVKDSIRKNAEFFINTQGVLGEQYLEIQPGSWDQPPLDASRSVDGVSPPRTDLIVARLYEFLDSITGLLRDDKDVIRDFLQSGASVVRTLDTILKDNRAEIGRLLVNVDALTREASQLMASIRSGVGDAAQLR